MAKIRSIKPEFFTSEDVSALPLRARLTWIGLWTHCDDHGRAKDNVKLIKAAIWPLDDVSLRDVEEDLAQLAAGGRIIRYEVDGHRYLQVTNWHHQYIAKPSKAKAPPPPDHDTEATMSRQGDDSVTTTWEGKGREGKGTRASARPPATCPRHPQGTDQPCGACATARRQNDPRTPTAPALPTVDEALNPTLDQHGFPAGACPVCRRAGAA